MFKHLRDFVCIAALACTSYAHSAEIDLKLAHSWPKGFPIFGTSVDEYASLVEEMSDGRISIKVDSRHKHKSAFGIFDFEKSGQYDIGNKSFSTCSPRERPTKILQEPSASARAQ